MILVLVCICLCTDNYCYCNYASLSNYHQVLQKIYLICMPLLISFNKKRVILCISQILVLVQYVVEKRLS